LMVIAGFFAVIKFWLEAAHPWKAAPFVALGPFAYALMPVIGAVILIVPYMIVATPMALFHRWMLLKVFAPAGPATPNTGPNLRRVMKAGCLS
jgi:hypothetical protein